MIEWIVGGAIVAFLVFGGEKKSGPNFVAPKEWRIKVFESERGLGWSGNFPQTIRVGDRLIADLSLVLPVESVEYDKDAIVLSDSPYSEDTEAALVPVKAGKYRVVFVTAKYGQVSVDLDVVAA